MIDRDLERLLDSAVDSALPAYLAEPAPGLADRVVVRLDRRRLRWPPLLGAVAAAALLALVWWPREAVKQPQAPIQPALRQAVLQQAAPPLLVLAKPAIRRRMVKTAALAARITPQERRLAEFVRWYPELARQVLPAEPQGFVEPLSAPEPVLIRPLGTE